MPKTGALRKALKVAAGPLSSARWSRSRRARRIRLHEHFLLFDDRGDQYFAAIISFPPADERYYVPLVISDRMRPQSMRPFQLPGNTVIDEAELSRPFANYALAAMRNGDRTAGAGGHIVWNGTAVPPGKAGQPRKLGGDTTNVVVELPVGNKRVVFKSYRTFDPYNPEPELLAYLTAAGCTFTPRVLGSYHLVRNGGRNARPETLGILLERAEGIDGFGFFVANARQFIEAKSAPETGVAGKIGKALGGLHLCLLAPGAPGTIRSEPVTVADTKRWCINIRKSCGEAFGLIPRGVIAENLCLRDNLETLLDKMASWAGHTKARTHQDFHLGQLLVGPGGVTLIDFEGEPLRRGPARVEKLPPERDAATMLRSVAYAAAVALERNGTGAVAGTAARASIWESMISSAFLRGYEDAAPPAVKGRDFHARIRVWTIQKAIYEVIYESTFRPGWVKIPLDGLRRLLAREA